MKDGKCKEIFKIILKGNRTVFKRKEVGFQEKDRKNLPTAGKRNNHLVLLCSRPALYSVSVNSQDFRVSTCTV
jgi:hypothetical protein